MRILVIRPENQARQTAEKLTALGHEAVILPLFEPVHDLELAKDALKSSFWALAATSAETVRCLAKLGDSLEPHLDRPFYTVGRATARAVKEAGFRNIATSIGSGRELAAVIAGGFARNNGPASPLLYLAAANRAGLLEQTLARNDIEYVTAEIYKMSPLQYTIEQQQKLLVSKPVDAVLLFSRENAKAFFSLDILLNSRNALKRTLFFCLSKNIAEIVPEEFANSTVVSMTPDEDELLDLL